MGTVFAATHRNNGSRAAIKVLHPEFARDSDTKSRFLQEGYAANQVGHAGVVRIIDDDTTEEGMPFIVMELLEGQLLEQRRIAAGGKLPLEEVYEIATQLLDVMGAAHAKGIVHRDIKPDNIFVTGEGLIKVLDFGFARLRDGSRTEQTATGFLLGTPGFMSPEQAAGTRDKIDARTDVWAIGATLFLLSTGQPVHEGETAAEMLVASANFAVRPIGELEPNLPLRFRQIVDKALAFDRNDRFADAKAMLVAVRAMTSRAAPADEDQRTLMRPSPVSSPHEDRTVMGRVEELPADVLESIHTMGPTNAPHPHRVSIHPADADQHTLALDPNAPTMQVPHLGMAGHDVEPTSPGTGSIPDLSAAPDLEPADHTVMMRSRPVIGVPPSRPSPMQPMAPAPAPPPSYPDLARHTPPPSSPHLMPYSQPHPSSPQLPMARPAPAKSEGGGLSSALVFIAVAGITMVVVILTGLVVIVGTE